MSRTQHGTLTANVLTTVAIDGSYSQITISNRSLTGEIYFTTDGTVPVVGAANTFVCLLARLVQAPASTATTVSLISATAAKFSVEGESS